MTYRFEYEATSLASIEPNAWQGMVLDEEGYIVCDVWNNGLGMGNFYAWHNGEARWGIEEEAMREYTGDDDAKAALIRESDPYAPLDAWVERLMREAK